MEVVNDLSVFDPDTACFADDGPHHVYWFRYPDGDARAVAYAEAGCHLLTVGKYREYREGERVAAAFADALAAQRADSTPSAATRAEGPGCSMPPMSQPISTLPHVPLAMTAATWCEGVGPYRMRATPIPAPLLQRINETLLGDPTDQRDDCEPSAYGRGIEGTTGWGDRVYYGVQGCDIYARTGYGRDLAYTVYEADRDLLAALKALPPGPVRRWQQHP
ncbi:hypothetical protein ACFQW6_12990 [Nocardioides sp. GCM10028917]|uniref:hypothetical protein n=1 Tax=Nocardioides sp. GCM10028917 TaxID=3273408 RepID=UPI00361A5EEC